MQNRGNGCGTTSRVGEGNHSGNLLGLKQRRIIYCILQSMRCTVKPAPVSSELTHLFLFFIILYYVRFQVFAERLVRIYFSLYRANFYKCPHLWVESGSYLKVAETANTSRLGIGAGSRRCAIFPVICTVRRRLFNQHSVCEEVFPRRNSNIYVSTIISTPCNRDSI